MSEKKRINRPEDMVPEGAMPTASIMLCGFVDQEGNVAVAQLMRNGNELEYAGMLALALCHLGFKHVIANHEEGL